MHYNEFIYSGLSLFLLSSFILLCGCETHKGISVLSKAKLISFNTLFLSLLMVYVMILIILGVIGNIINLMFHYDEIKTICTIAFILMSFYSLMKIAFIENISVKRFINQSSLIRIKKSKRIPLVDRRSLSLSMESIDENEEFGDKEEEGKEQENDYLERMKNNFIESKSPIELANPQIQIQIEENTAIKTKTDKSSKYDSGKSLGLFNKRSSAENYDNEHTYYDLMFIEIYLILSGEILSINSLFFILFSILFENKYFLSFSFMAVFLFYLLSLGSNGNFDKFIYMKVRQVLLAFMLMLCSSYTYYLI